MDYIIEKNNVIIYLDENVYPLIAIKKTVMYYLEKCYIEVEHKNNKVKIKIELLDKKFNIEIIVKEFINDCMREALRVDIAKETKNIRELILGRALYSSCIKIDSRDVTKSEENCEIEKILEEDYNIDEIAVDWFEKNRKEEL